MKSEIRQAVIQYLQKIVDLDPVINAQERGNCIYCGAELDRQHPHQLDCSFVEAQRLLNEMKQEEEPAKEIKVFDLHKDTFSNKNQKEWIDFFYKNLTEQTPLILFGKSITVTQIFWVKGFHKNIKITIRFSNGIEFKFDSFFNNF